MALTALTLSLQMVCALVLSGLPPYCYLSQCPLDIEPTVPAQYQHLAECIDGPDELVASHCGCADLDGDYHVSLRDFALFQVAPVHVCQRELAIVQSFGLGFCPPPGTIHRANVIPTLDGHPVLFGSKIEEGDPVTDKCLPDVWPPACLVDVPLPPLLLDSDEQQELVDRLGRIPRDGCDTGCLGGGCDSHCCLCVDPCIVWYLRYEGRFHDDYCFGCGNADVYRQAVTDVQEYLNELISEP